MLIDALKHSILSEIEWTCQNESIPRLYKKQSCFPEGAALCPKNSLKSYLNCFRTNWGKKLLCSYSQPHTTQEATA